jgi:predicted Zn-dependent protease
MQQTQSKNKVQIWGSLLTVALLLLAHPLQAKGLIRDAETEEYLKDLSDPVFKAAGLSPSQVRFFLISDESLNAFVAGGSNIFLHTGLIIEAVTPEMLLGVIAHETGHISGGHLIRADAFLERAQIGSVMTYLLGAAAIAGGGGQVGAAILAGSMQGATRSLLSYTRANEQAADQAAIGFLHTMGLSSEGMLQMFERLRREEKQHVGTDNQDVYTRTHPLSSDRISHMRSELATSHFRDVKLADPLQERHQRVRAKLIGFLHERSDVLVRYPLTDTSIPAHIARAIAYGDASQTAEAEAEVLQALKQSPDDAYLHELHGYLLFKALRMEESVTAYRKARTLKPNSALLRSDFAKPLMALGTSAALTEAKEELIFSSAADPTYQQTWQLLAQAYGKTGEIAMAELSLAELAALNSDKEELERHLDRIGTRLDPYSPAGLRAEDLRNFAKQLEEKEG